MDYFIFNVVIILRKKKKFKINSVKTFAILCQNLAGPDEIQEKSLLSNKLFELFFSFDSHTTGHRSGL